MNNIRNFSVIAYTKDSKLTIIENKKQKIYGVQFHPEVTHTDNGKQIFKNFLFSICKIKRNWSVVSQKKRLIREVQSEIRRMEVCPMNYTSLILQEVDPKQAI